MMNSMKKVMDLGRMTIKTNVCAARQVYEFFKNKNKVELRELGRSTINGKDVYLAEYDFLFAAMAQRDLPAAMCMGNAHMYTILVNKAWMNSSKAVKEAIVAHELGHIVEGHLDNPMWSMKNNLKRMLGHDDSIKAEIAADKYANKEGLLEFLGLADLHYRRLGLPMEEIYQRSEALIDC